MIVLIKSDGMIKEFQGLSTDVKPIDNPVTRDRVGHGSTFYEINTGKAFIYDININPVTNSGWWEV